MKDPSDRVTPDMFAPLGTSITWNYLMLVRFKKVMAQAVRQQRDTFEFDGHEFLVSYARYLIEYLDDMLDNAPHK